MKKEIETMRLFLLPTSKQRDNKPFLRMLAEDGDFRGFSGLPFSVQRLKLYESYFERGSSCYYSVFEKGGEEMIGYVGIGSRGSCFESEFYISKPYRRRGYCGEALQALLDEAFSGNLTWRNEGGTQMELVLNKLHAMTISSNSAAVRVLENVGL